MSKINKIVLGFRARLESQIKDTRFFDNFGLFTIGNEQSLCVVANGLNVDDVLVGNRGYEINLQVGIYGYIPVKNDEDGGIKERIFYTEILNALTNWRYADDITDVDIKEINFSSGTLGSTNTQNYRNGFNALFEVKFYTNDTF